MSLRRFLPACEKPETAWSDSALKVPNEGNHYNQHHDEDEHCSDSGNDQFMISAQDDAISLFFTRKFVTHSVT